MRARSVQIHGDRERGSSPLELALLLPFITVTFMIIVGLGYVLMAKHRALGGARWGCTHAVDTNAPSGDYPMGYIHQLIDLPWLQSMTFTNEGPPPAFVPFMAAFDSTGRATVVASWTPQRGIIPHLYPGMPPATASYTIPTTTSTCREMGGSSYLTYILNQGGVGDILGTDSQDCCAIPGE